MGAIILVLLFQQISGSGAISGPTNLQAGRSVYLEWVASTTQGVGYRVYRSATAGGPYTLHGFGIKGVAYTDWTVQTGRTYYYVCRAVDADGNESVNSNEAVAVVQ